MLLRSNIVGVPASCVQQVTASRCKSQLLCAARRCRSQLVCAAHPSCVQQWPFACANCSSVAGSSPQRHSGVARGVLYGLYSVWCCIAVCTYSVVWDCMAVWRRGGGVTMRGACMERHTAKYSEIQQKSIQQTIQSQPSHMAHGAAATPTLRVVKLQ